MRKTILILSLVILSSLMANAQTTVITDDSLYTPSSTNALFEVYSQNNNKGILIPRLTTSQRVAILTSGVVDQSLMVYDTDTKTFWYFDGANWVEMATGGTVSDDQNIDRHYPKKCVNEKYRVQSLRLNPIFKYSHKLVKNQAPISNRHCPFFSNLSQSQVYRFFNSIIGREREFVFCIFSNLTIKIFN